MTKAAEAISPLVSLRGAEGDEAISVGTRDCRALLAMPKASLSAGNKSRLLRWLSIGVLFSYASKRVREICKAER